MKKLLFFILAIVCLSSCQSVSNMLDNDFFNKLNLVQQSNKTSIDNNLYKTKQKETQKKKDGTLVYNTWIEDFDAYIL